MNELFPLYTLKKENENWLKGLNWQSNLRVASGLGISGNLEKSGNFLALAKCQGISWNLEKSGNFNAKLRKVREFYLHETNISKVFQDSFKWWKRINHTFSHIAHAHEFLSKNKNEFKLWNSLLSFWIRKCTVTN